MRNSLAFYIGLRYTRAKRRNGFISFISLASMLGIALGVAVLITVLSVMNGFDYQIRTKIFALTPEINVMTRGDIQKTWRALGQKILTLPSVTGVAPFVTGQGMLVQNGAMFGVQLMGIDPTEEGHVSALASKMVAGKLTSLAPDTFHIVLGKTLADNLGVHVGEKITLFTPETSVTLAGVIPRYKRFIISGIFHTSSALGFDNAYAYVNMQDAARLFPPGRGTSGLHVAMDNMYGVTAVGEKIREFLPPGYVITNWTQTYGAFFQALWMEKTALFVILLLIVAVATFNLVSTLVMVVNDKRADIAILRTLGASPGMIMKTFIVQGMIVGLIGIAVGVIGGLLLAYYATAITDWLQTVFHVKLISESVLFVNYLPSRIVASNVVWICVAAFILSLLATLYPAWTAFRTQPAEALRYE